MEQLVYAVLIAAVGFGVGVLVGRHNAAKFEPYAAEFDAKVAKLRADAQKVIDELNKKVQ